MVVDIGHVTDNGIGLVNHAEMGIGQSMVRK
jgi:hypothetical protein